MSPWFVSLLVVSNIMCAILLGWVLSLVADWLDW